jgi:hypothetical protein
MSEIDCALDGKPRQLPFRQNYAPLGDPRIFDGTGQLVAVVADGHRPDNGDEIAISQPNVALAVTAALEGWEEWAALYVADYGPDRVISLPAIQRRIQGAGLGLKLPQ